MRIDPETALLQALLSGPGYGLELIERVKEKTQGKLTLNQGNAYPTLRALERDGLIESYKSEGPQERGGRPRIYYRLTGEGLRAARETRETGLLLFGSSPHPAAG
jgi:PadR family transcriptional regulator PadR